MNKKISISLVFLMLISIFTFSSCNNIKINSGDITGCSKNVSTENRYIPNLSVDDNGDFTVLQISDLHLINGSTKKDTKTLNAVKEQIIGLSPKLVVVSGDMIEGNNNNKNYNKKTALQTIGDMFESLNQYWAYVPGNNDGECMGSSDDVVAFLTQYEHCIVSNDINVTGAAEYIIDLKNSDGNTVHSLIFLDSLARDADHKYDYIKDDEVLWLKNILADKRDMEGNIKVSIFFHMNTPDFTLASENGMSYNDKYYTVSTKLKNNIPKNSSIDEVIENSGIVGLVSIGHIHPDNNWCSFYQDRYYHIVRAAGYYATKNPGCVLITIHSSSKSTKEMYDFKELVFDKNG